MEVAIVVNPALRWGKPGGGETKSTDRKLAGVYSFISLNSYRNLVHLPLDYADGGKNFSIHPHGGLVIGSQGV